MSRFKTLQVQHQERKNWWNDHWNYLELHAEELADDFGLWLAQDHRSHTGQSRDPIPVKAVARFLNKQGEEAYTDHLQAGRIDESLQFALEIRVADDDSVFPPSVLRLNLAMLAWHEDVKVTVIDSGRAHSYSRSQLPQALFEELFRACETALSV